MLYDNGTDGLVTAKTKIRKERKKPVEIEKRPHDRRGSERKSVGQLVSDVQLLGGCEGGQAVERSSDASEAEVLHHNGLNGIYFQA